MSSLVGGVLHYGTLALLLIGKLLLAGIVLAVLKVLYNISPFHPLAKYPGPLLWRASRLVNSYHHASGDLYQHIAAIHEKYGHTVRIAPDELSFTAPEAWPEIYNSRPQLVKSRFHFGQDESGRMPTSMITAPDLEHMRVRRLAGPAFLNAGVSEVEPVMQRYAELLCTQLRDASKEGSQNMVEWFLWVLNDVIGQLALDQEFDCLKKRRLHEWPSYLMHILKIGAAVNQFKRFGVKMSWLRVIMPASARQKQEKFFETAKNAVDARLAREDDISSETTSGKRPDIIGLMLREMKGGDRLTEKEILSNSILIVGGGAETTATTLTATFYNLCKTPRAMQKLKDEIRGTFSQSEDITLKAIADLPYLKAVLDENLRIFPTASFITPRLTPKEGHVIDGNFIPGDTYVSMGQWFMGRSNRFFDNAMEFRPERWVDSEVQKACGRRADDILKPFSMGPRNCIGKLLALAEARLILAKLIWHFDFELDGDHATWVEDARFYVLWELQPLKLHVTPVQ
ncbi:Putative cytochrome P450 [Septoria linicola]|uniref:Cytochrome P450 n=1 Tax=Septoria linicola TaxID=215465 RepID=A0A9Q9ELJ8_9PEZI|nr:putative cytochrome P450 [Septoria linicola]USW55155.1 Putative cytochrome P450 [Septoria linicola]